MRLWTLLLKYLHKLGLLGLWKEGNLALSVIHTDKGYSNHSQLIRFKNYPKDKNEIYLYNKLLNDMENNNIELNHIFILKDGIEGWEKI